MKRLRYLYVGIFLIFGLIFVFANVLQKQREEVSNQDRNIVMNRIASLVETNMKEGDAEPEVILQKVFYDKKDNWQQEYDECLLPVAITYLSAEQEKSEVNNVTDITSSQSVWVLYDQDKLAGFLLFSYSDASYHQKALIMNVFIMITFALTMGIILYIHNRILKPFWKLSTYPESLSKGNFTDKLPETKNRYFGKFVWSVNMLADKLSYDKKHINRLIKERQTLLATIAHGIKTPVSNIKLYANAVESGLYQVDGVPNEKDAEIAVKISKNADDIANLVQEIIQTSMEGLVDFVPNPQSFYSTEIKDYIEEAYANRLKVLRIPYKAECVNKTLVSSDKNGIIR
ncbi:MAG: histidine kinase dimerization/phospho-acceptor domain-containing protein, partial [Coprococcus sp.]